MTAKKSNVKKTKKPAEKVPSGLVEQTLKALERNGFHAHYAPGKKEVCELISGLIPVNESIGIGDSATLRQMGVAESLTKEGRFLLNPFADSIIGWMNEGKITGDDQIGFCRMALSCDWFLTGTNMLTRTGILLNTDCTGNRVAGMFFGPRHSVMVVGRNKIVGSVEEGYERLRNICGVYHSKTKQRNNPCIKSGKCMNCNSPDRLCRVTTMIEKKPKFIDAHVIIVDKDLGLAWDPSWPEKKIDTIYENYAKVTRLKRPAWMDGLR